MEKEIKKVKDLALRMLLEEHLYKIRESDSFHFGNIEYKIERVEDGFSISRWVGDSYTKGMIFSSLGKLFNHFFTTNGINVRK